MKDLPAGGHLRHDRPSEHLADVVDQHEFRAAFDRELPRVWRYLRRRVSSTAEADDLSAEVFATAWRRRHDLPAPEDLTPWLLATARRVAANHHRSIRRRTALVERSGRLDPPRPTAGPADADPADPRAARLWTALARLGDQDRELLLLRAWDELPVGEIALLLGCTPNAASIRLTRARSRLATELAQPAEPTAATAPPAPPAPPESPAEPRTSVQRGARHDGAAT